VILPPQWEKDALALVEQASPLDGEFFRSVELAYGHPDDVISGEGTRMYGGRFVKPGSRAVYGSADEETAFKESAARLSRLAGRGGARIIAHARITYVIAVRVAVNVDLTAPRVPRALSVPCIDPNDVTASQEVGEFLRSQVFRRSCSRLPSRGCRPERHCVPRHDSAARHWPRQSRADPSGASPSCCPLSAMSGRVTARP
jgi:RES domain-containing protein